MRVLGLCCAMLLAVGCTDVVRNEPQKKEPEQKSFADDAVDTVVIQKGKIDAGRRTADKVRAIDAERRQTIREAEEAAGD